jgi:serine/threonine protein kinase
VAHILRQVAGSLEEAHRRGLVHRDIKPANVMLCTIAGIDDVIKVLDFGLAHSTNDPKTGAPRLEGTLRYMAPEHILRPQTTRFSVDIYGLGILGYVLLTGHDPFIHDEETEMLTQVINLEPLPAKVAPEGQPLLDLIRSCLAKTPEQRPPSVKDFLFQLNALNYPTWVRDHEKIHFAPQRTLQVMDVFHGQGKRNDQQDRWLVLKNPNLLAVIDGMGGHPGGNEAADRIVQALQKLPNQTGIAEVNHSISESRRSMMALAQQHPEWESMGATLALVLYSANTLRVAWSGDSRLYRLNATGNQILTQDHVADGKVSQWIGPAGPVDPLEWASVEIQPGDRYLLATDGFYHLMETNRLPWEELPSIHSISQASAEDNFTAILFAF